MKAVSITVTRDGDALVSTAVNPKDTIFNNKFVTPAKAAIQFSKELTSAVCQPNLTANELQFVLKGSAGHIVETVGTQLMVVLPLVNFTLIRQELTLILLKKLWN